MPTHAPHQPQPPHHPAPASEPSRPGAAAAAGPVRLPARSALAVHWPLLDPGTVYLNHGSFGACPAPVLEAQRRYRDRMERDGVLWFTGEAFERLDAARAALAAFVGANPRDLVLVPNATLAVATVMKNLDLRPGDELLVTDHEYAACRSIFRESAARAGASVVSAPVAFPLRSDEEVVESVLSRVTRRTRLCLLSHVTSPSGLVLPAARIVRELRERGVETLVDGAHAPGFLALDVSAIGAAYYTANCHKWVCSPKGSAFLWVREDLQRGFRPLALSVYADHPRRDRSFLHTEFDYIGTDDRTGAMAIADALAFMGGLRPGGWAQVVRENRDLALRGRDILCAALGIEPPAPDAMLGAMATLPLPEDPDPARRERLRARPTRFADALQDALLERHRVQVPVWGAGVIGPRSLRISAQLYNTPAEYEHLAGALREELARERAG